MKVSDYFKTAFTYFNERPKLCALVLLGVAGNLIFWTTTSGSIEWVATYDLWRPTSIGRVNEDFYVYWSGIAATVFTIFKLRNVDSK